MSRISFDTKPHALKAGVQRSWLWLCAVTLLTLVSCTVAYDSSTDEQITALTQQINQQFTTWIVMTTDHIPVEYDPKSYSKMESDVASLGIRLQASPDYETQRLARICIGTGTGIDSLTQQPSLQNQLDQLRIIHLQQKVIRDPQVLVAALRSFNVQLAALTTYELSLKSGSSPSTASAVAMKPATGTSAIAGVTP